MGTVSNFAPVPFIAINVAPVPLTWNNEQQLEVIGENLPNYIINVEDESPHDVVKIKENHAIL